MMWLKTMNGMLNFLIQTPQLGSTILRKYNH
jgi:hypothetical protein